MTSAINPQNIDGTYPVAGQDNDSQGFRDNFTNIKTNFGYASAEITDLQSKVVLKSALTGTVLNNNMGGSILQNAQLQNMSETRVTVGGGAVSTGNTATISYSAGSYQTFSTAGGVGTITLTFTNFSPAGTLSRVRVQINVTNIAHTITLPAAVSVGTNNIQGISSNVITFNKTGKYEFEFETSDNGATITIIDQNRNLDPVYYPSAEDLANAAAIDLGVTTSYFITAAAETATLADGAEGQIKNLVCAGYVGDMVVTVANAGWGGAGTITFSAVGQGCQLIFLGGNWWCIGNNDATFA
jgi:hypothetical protein